MKNPANISVPANFHDYDVIRLMEVNVRTRSTIVSYQNALRTLRKFYDKTGYEDHLDAINMDFYNIKWV